LLPNLVSFVDCGGHRPGYHLTFARRELDEVSVPHVNDDVYLCHELLFSQVGVLGDSFNHIGLLSLFQEASIDRPNPLSPNFMLSANDFIYGSVHFCLVKSLGCKFAQRLSKVTITRS
jgi:hypothetical protein